MSRKRKLENRDLPPFLYLRKGIYFYRDHRSGKEYSLGKNKTLAISQAIQANIEILTPKINLLDRINNIKVITLYDWLDDYFNILNQRGLKPKSISDYLSQINIIKNKFENTSLDEITPRQIQKFIDDYGKPTMARLLRSLLSDSFNEAVRYGIVEKNPVLSTKPPKIIIARKRLTLDEFNIV